jgi:LysM repeat protein
MCAEVVAQPAHPRLTKEDYIQQYQRQALDEMKRAGIPASIKLAQAIVESDCGNSRLAMEANNHFGIKCHKEWMGDTFYQDDDEKDECFRKYNSVMESYRDHSEFLRTRPRYAFLFDLDITDYKGWAHGLKKAGYATNPNYAHQLIKVIEEYGLYELDRTGKAIPIGKKETGAAREKDTPASRADASAPAVAGYINNTPYVVARKGDTYYSLAVAHNMALWQLLRYNDAGKNDILTEGEVVFLKPKRKKAQVEWHVVAPGETLRSISQLYGIKLKKIYKYNKLTPGSSINPGERIRLR